MKAFTALNWRILRSNLAQIAIRTRKVVPARVAAYVSSSLRGCLSPRTHSLALNFVRKPCVSNLYENTHFNGILVMSGVSGTSFAVPLASTPTISLPMAAFHSVAYSWAIACSYDSGSFGRSRRWRRKFDEERKQEMKVDCGFWSIWRRRVREV